MRIKVKKLRLISGLMLGSVIAGCTTLATIQLESRYGPSEPRNRVVTSIPADHVDYWRDVNPIVENRCVVCHACYDAPCQLKMESIEGIDRGASKDLVYLSTRITAGSMSRLFEDETSTAGWRSRKFYPVLNERGDSVEANQNAGVMHRMLQLKRSNPMPDQKLLPESFDISLNREQVCPKPSEFDQYASANPLAGMPYGLPGLEDDQLSVLLKWLEQGAGATVRPALPDQLLDNVAVWEGFLNGDSLKQRLMSRYIYEHLFLANLYFSEFIDPEPDAESAKPVFFRMVRSKTAPGQPVERISTRRPYNEPGVDRVYYRLIRNIETPVSKTHLPYALNSSRMSRWQELFVETDYEVESLPSYFEPVASNPFITFDAIPVSSRYRFLLDEAHFTIQSFIKGPVCRGQVALNVINDHFWIFFSNPDSSRSTLYEKFLSDKAEYMALPASTINVFRPIARWKRYAVTQKNLLREADAYLDHNFGGFGAVSLENIWDGDGVNSSAALTVFRHFDSASVEKGMVGPPPKTAWFINYPLLERIHYLLVAGYDVYGNVGHQFLSRVYMDFLRMEGEMGFLLLLPEEARNRERKFWYRGADREVAEYMTFPRFERNLIPNIRYRTADHKLELFAKIEKRLSGILNSSRGISEIENARIRDALANLQGSAGPHIQMMPQVTFLKIAGDRDTYFTLLRVNAHLNITSLFEEQKNRAPDEDTLVVVRGFLGDRPNAFLVVEESNVSEFSLQLGEMKDQSDYSRLLDRFGVRRTSKNFWEVSDDFHFAYKKQNHIEYGVFDYARLENR